MWTELEENDCQIRPVLSYPGNAQNWWLQQLLGKKWSGGLATLIKYWTLFFKDHPVELFWKKQI